MLLPLFVFGCEASRRRRLAVKPQASRDCGNSPITPLGPLDLASDVNAPVLGLYGGADPGIPVPQIQEMQAKLKSAHMPCEIVIYPDTPHAFNADYRPSYRGGPAKDRWKRMLAWLKSHGIEAQPVA